MAPTDEEVARAQSETLNSFVFNFASTNAQMQRVLIYALLGLPDVSTTAADFQQTLAGHWLATLPLPWVAPDNGLWQ